MKKNLILYIILSFLIVVNGFFLFNYLGRPSGKGSKGPDNFIVKELKFDQSQMDQFKTISNTHHKKMKSILDEIKKQKDVLFGEISKELLNRHKIDSIITLIGVKEQQKEAEVFYNLRAIHKLCNNEQKKRFSDIVKSARRKGRNQGPNPPRDNRPPRKN